MKGAVSSGHPLTTEAACEILRMGGNAFDAIVAAGFASSVTEPALTSLGGGGFLLNHVKSLKRDILFDFFVDTPGKGHRLKGEPELIPVELKFKSTVQTFHIGMGSVAVPGKLKGLIHCYSSLCSMDIDDIIRPAVRYLEEGVEVTDYEAYLLTILEPILSFTEYGREIFDLRRHSRLYNPLLLQFLKERSPDRWLDIFYNRCGSTIEDEMLNNNGILTSRDMAEYDVCERDPLCTEYRGFDLVTNPPPSFGGTILSMAFSLLEDMDFAGMTNAGIELQKAFIMRRMNEFRKGAAGTTQISILDSRGNAAAMTVSNGSSSGCFLADTGIMLNNMMGEDDLHPEGFGSVESGQRVRSMMSPSFIRKNNNIFAVLGSGGSKRIRTALLQVIINLIDKRMDVRSAVEAPRIHLDDNEVLQVEPGFGEDVISSLGREFALNTWKEKDMYFGGVHTVLGDLSGWGDSRRGGCHAVV